MNSTTFFRTSSSVKSKSAAIRFDSARRAILCGLEIGGSVGKGCGDSQVPESTFAGGEKDVGEYGRECLDCEDGLSANKNCTI